MIAHVGGLKQTKIHDTKGNNLATNASLGPHRITTPRKMVSISSTSADVLVGTIIDSSLFSSADSGTPIDENFFMEKVLPRMLTGDTVSLETAAVAAEKGLQVGLVA